jgi:hypothetical protein
MFNTKTRTTAEAIITITARDPGYWDPSASCLIVYKAVNATSGSVLAEAWVKVEAQ